MKQTRLDHLQQGLTRDTRLFMLAGEYQHFARVVCDHNHMWLINYFFMQRQQEYALLSTINTDEDYTLQKAKGITNCLQVMCEIGMPLNEHNIGQMPTLNTFRSYFVYN